MESQARWKIQAGMASHQGKVRQVNQDACFMAPEKGLFILSDGMGGHQAGEVASQTVVNILPKIIRKRLSGVASPRDRIAELILQEGIADLSQQLQAEGAGHAGLRGMGATVVVAWLCLSPGVAHLAHMGDSRIYRFRQGRLAQLTEDHSLVALLLKHGEITPEQIQDHPARSHLSRYIGMEEEVLPEVQTIDLDAGDRLLLCSDGLTNMVPDGRIEGILRTTRDPQDACQALVAAANVAGGKDNISVIVVDVHLNPLWRETGP